MWRQTSHQFCPTTGSRPRALGKELTPTSFTIFPSIQPVFPFHFFILIINQIYSYIKRNKWERECRDCGARGGLLYLTWHAAWSIVVVVFKYGILVLDLNWFKLGGLVKTHPKIILTLLVTSRFAILYSRWSAKPRFRPNMIRFHSPVHRLRFLLGEKH